MAAPLTFLEKKWAAGYSNTLVRAATQTTDRAQIAPLDKDFQRSITPYGRRTLLTIGRWLYWNVSAVRGTVNEIADLAVQHWIPQFEGEDQAWGNEVENWFFEHDKICDVRGGQFTMGIWRKNLVRSILVDGDMATMLVKNADGYPMIQVFPSHRIGNTLGETVVKGGAYDGARIIDGCIVDDLGRVIAYRVLGEDGAYNGTTYQDVPARDLFLSYLIETPDQIRGLSTLGASCFDWQDLGEARRFELIAQKLGATVGLIETNETGEADKTKKLLSRSSTNFDTQTAGTAPKLSTTATETIDGVTVRYHRANSGAKIEAFKNDRPTANQQAFRDDVIREALHGMGWSFDYSYNPTKIGGAPMRVVVDRINRKLECLREDIVLPAQRRVDGYRVACVMDNPERTDKKTVLFNFNKDWFKWSYQGPAKLTADAKYNSDVDREEMRAGIKTMAKAAGERGNYWKDEREQIEKEADDALTRAKKLATKHKIGIEVALVLIRDLTSYSTLTNSADAGDGGNADPKQDKTDTTGQPEDA